MNWLDLSFALANRKKAFFKRQCKRCEKYTKSKQYNEAYEQQN